eukprot:1639786-Prymnesium_polylepis.2
MGAPSSQSSSTATTSTARQVHLPRLKPVHRCLITGWPDPRNTPSDSMLPGPCCRCAWSIGLMQRNERCSGLRSGEVVTAASCRGVCSCNAARMAYRVGTSISACKLRPALSVCGMRTKHWLRAKGAEVISWLCGHLSAYAAGNV